MKYQQLLYSLDENITITNIKKGFYDKNVDVSKVEKWSIDNGIDCMQLGESNYHFKFESIKSKPYFIYYKGNSNLFNKPIISIVGPRKMSDYSIKVLEELFKYLKNYDCVTISGLADGIDNLCHELSIKNKVPTIAVLGGGVGRFMQSKKKSKIEKIINNGGLILSEFKLKQEPTNYTFPQRNRIIAGLSRTVFVPEAGEVSGTLITVQNAIDMNIPVFATSNSYFENNSKGINNLISQKKVSLVFDFEVYLDQFFQKNTKKRLFSDQINVFDNSSLSDIQKNILKVIQKNNGASIELIQSEIGIGSGLLLTELSILEIEGIIAQLNPGKYEFL